MEQLELASEFNMVPHKDSAEECLSTWLCNRTELSFVYARSKGGIIVTGRAVITSLTEAVLRLRSAQSSLMIVTSGAKFSTEPQVFFTSDLQRSFMVDGVGVRLQNFDWLFFSSSASSEELALGQPQLDTRE